MQTGNGRDEAQAEAIARSLAASLEPIEALEHVSDLVARNSRSLIGNRNTGPGVTFPDLHGHASRFTTVLDGIVHEIGHCVEQKIPIARDQHALVTERIDL